MKKIVFHSFKGGTGKSNFVANLAVALAFKGLRVGVADLDFKGPGLSSFFNIDEEETMFKLNDFLSGECSAISCAISLTERLDIKNGDLFFMPASLKMEDILAVYKIGYEVDNLTVGLMEVMENLELDFLLIDTHPGLDEDTLLAMLICDAIFVLSRLNRQDYLGTAVTLEVLNKLKYAELKKPIHLIVNSVPNTYNPREIAKEFERVYKQPVLAVIPFYMEVLAERDRGIFCLKHPSHPFSVRMAEISEKLLLSIWPQTLK